MNENQNQAEAELKTCFKRNIVEIENKLRLRGYGNF